MDIAGVGPAVAQQLIHEGLVNDIADLYYLKLRRGDMLKLERWEKRKVDTLLQQIERRLLLLQFYLLLLLFIDIINVAKAKVSNMYLPDLELTMLEKKLQNYWQSIS